MGEKARTWVAWSLVPVLLGALLVAAWIALGYGAKAAPAASAPEAVLAASESAAPSGGPTEGVKVHGAWTIEVRNPDGTVASSTGFENEFVGDAHFSQILAHQLTPGSWIVLLGSAGDPTQGPCASVSGFGTRCAIQEGPEPYDAAQSKNLTVSVDSSNRVVLSGTVNAQFAVAIGNVATALGYCAADVTPTACPSSNTQVFYVTQRSLGGAVAVAEGQQIAVTVKISFSS